LPALQQDDVFKMGLLLLQTAVGNFDVLDLQEEVFKQSPLGCCLLHRELPARYLIDIKPAAE